MVIAQATVMALRFRKAVESSVIFFSLLVGVVLIMMEGNKHRHVTSSTLNEQIFLDVDPLIVHGVVSRINVQSQAR